MTCERQSGLETPINGVLALCMLAATACGEEEDVTNIEDAGALCVSPIASGIGIKVIFDACLSPGCDRKESARCDARLVDGQIRVTSNAKLVSVNAPEMDCSTACVPPATTCELVMPQAGTFGIVHGNASGTIVLPLDEPVALLGPDNACERATE